MTIFQHLKTKALEYAQMQHIVLVDFGVSASMIYAIVADKEKKAIGVTLIPHGEGELCALQGTSIEKVFELSSAFNPLQRAFALAVINALGQHALSNDENFDVSNKGVQPLLTEKILDVTQEGDEVVFVGNLRPVVTKLKDNGRKPIVFCRQKQQYGDGVYSDIFEYEVIQSAPIAIITGASLIGSTLDALIHLSPKGSMRILAGFSAGAYPKWFEGSGLTHNISMKLDIAFKEALIKNRWEEVFTYPGYWNQIRH